MISRSAAELGRSGVASSPGACTHGDSSPTPSLRLGLELCVEEEARFLWRKKGPTDDFSAICRVSYLWHVLRNNGAGTVGLQRVKWLSTSSSSSVVSWDSWKKPPGCVVWKFLDPGSENVSRCATKKICCFRKQWKDSLEDYFWNPYWTGTADSAAKLQTWTKHGRCVLCLHTHTSPTQNRLGHRWRCAPPLHTPTPKNRYNVPVTLSNCKHGIEI